MALLVEETTASRECKVKDMSQANFGRHQIDFADVEMPGLMAFRAEFGPSQPLKGAKITGALPLTNQTAVLLETLTAFGAEVRCNTFYPQDRFAAASAHLRAAISDFFLDRTTTGREFKVQGMSQADFGRHQIDIAEVEMPGLMAFRAEFGPSQPLKGAKITGALPLTNQTAVLLETLTAFGAEVRCNNFSPQDSHATALAHTRAAISALSFDKTTTGLEYKVKDMSQADFGRHQIDLAEVEMPGLMACRAKFGPSQPLKGAKITVSHHMTNQTAVQIETLTALGAEVRWCSFNTFSTEDHAAAAIARDSASVFAWSGENLEEYWWCTERALDWGPGGGPDLIVDAGRNATLFIHEGVKAEEIYEKTGKFPDLASIDNAEIQIVLTIIRDGLMADPKRYHKMKERLVGVSEETNTGFKWLCQMQANGTLLFPAINVNESFTKRKVELTTLRDAYQEDACQGTETKMVEMSALNQRMVEMSALNQRMCTHVLQLARQIKRLYEQFVEANKDVELGNKELSQAIQRNSSRTLLVLFLFVLTFSIIFLDWYSQM